MAISDTKSAQKYASIAEVAAAEAKSYAEDARKSESFSKQAKESADAAEMSAVNSAESAAASQASAQEAANSSSEALVSANNAAASANNASISANVYSSEALAQAAIDAGTIPLNALFAVSIIGSENYQEQYTNAAGLATPTGKVLKDGAYIEALSYEIDNIKEIFPEYHQDSSLVALFEDESGNVPLYLDNGAVAFSAIETGSAQNVINTSELPTAHDLGISPYRSYHSTDLSLATDLIAFLKSTIGVVPVAFGTGGDIKIIPTSGSAAIHASIIPFNAVIYVAVVLFCR